MLIDHCNHLLTMVMICHDTPWCTMMRHDLLGPEALDSKAASERHRAEWGVMWVVFQHVSRGRQWLIGVTDNSCLTTIVYHFFHNIKGWLVDWLIYNTYSQKSDYVGATCSPTSGRERDVHTKDRMIVNDAIFIKPIGSMVHPLVSFAMHGRLDPPIELRHSPDQGRGPVQWASRWRTNGWWPMVTRAPFHQPLGYN